MKTIETKGGMIFEIWTSRKEVLHDLEMLDFDSCGFDDLGDETLYIEYKDGSTFMAGWNGVKEGKFKRTNIKTAIYSNASTTALYGDYVIYNVDNTDEEYSEEVDDVEKFWNADAR